MATAAVPLSKDVLEAVVRLATPERARITVLSVARVYGTSLGFPNPGLQPNRLEIEENKRIIEEAADTLRKRGFEVRVGLSKSRNAPKMIARWAKAKNFHAIVVPDPDVPGRNGATLVAAAVAEEYGVTDVDGRRPRPLTLADV